MGTRDTTWMTCTENTHEDRLELVFFYESELGQLVYSGGASLSNL